MKFSTPLFIQVLNVLEKEKSVAEYTSSYSDLLSWRIHPRFLKNARSCRLAIVTISYLGLNPIQEEDLKRRFWRISEKYRFQGEWSRVRDLLTLPIFSPGNVLTEHLQDRNLHDFFGNDLRTIRAIWRTLKVYNPYIPKETPVKYPERKRGYDDKGTLRTSSLSIEHFRRPGEEQEEDFNITNTHFFENFETGRRNNAAQETLVVNRTSSQGGDDFERNTMDPPIETNREQVKKTGDSERLSNEFDFYVKSTGYFEKIRQIALQVAAEEQLKTKEINILENIDYSVLIVLRDDLQNKSEEIQESILRKLMRHHYQKNVLNHPQVLNLLL